MPTLYLHTGRQAIERLFGEYRRVFDSQSTDDRAVWVAPSSSYAGGLRRRLAEDGVGAVLRPGVFTSQQLASRVIALAGDGRGERRLDTAAARKLLGGVIDRLLSAGRLEHYGGLQPRGALIDLLLVEIDHAAARGGTPDRLVAAAKRSGGDRQREFAEVFADYHQLKSSLGVLDRVDRWRLATELLRRGEGAGGWRLAVVAPMEAATRVEEDFLAAVLQASERAAAAAEPAPWEVAGGTTVAALLGRFEELFERVEVIEASSSGGFLGRAPGVVDRSESPVGENHDLAFVREWLFRDPRDAPVPPSPSSSGGVWGGGVRGGGVRVAVGGGAQQEVQWVAADIKRRLLEGLDADEVLIAAPSVRAIAGRVTQAFRRVGTPLAIATPTRLGEAPVVGAMLSLLALPTGGWRHDDVLRVLTSPALRAFERLSDSAGGAGANASPSHAELAAVGLAGPRAAAELAIRRLLLPRGRDVLADQLLREADYLAGRIGQEQEASRGDRRGLGACWSASAAVELLGAALDALPKAAPPVVWFDALRGLLDRLGYSASSAASLDDSDDSSQLDLAALDALEDAFASHERLVRWGGRSGGKLDLAAAAGLLADWAPRLTIDPGLSDEGRVRLVPLDQAIDERPRVLYVVGLVEGSLPRPMPINDPLAEGAAVARAAHNRQEMRRFHQLVTSASELVVLSFAGIDGKAQPLNPSSYVAEVERLFLPRSLRIDTVSEEGPALSETSLRRGAVRGLMAGDDQGLRRFVEAAVDGDAARLALDGVAATLERSTGETFGAMEGILVSDAARREFATRFGPEHLWSPSQLELYAECPYKFFLRYVLGTEPLDPLAIDLDYRRRGSLLHEAMVRFHQALPDAGGAGIAEAEFLERFELAIRSAGDSVAVAPHERPVARVEGKQAAAWGPPYREQLEKYSRDPQAPAKGARGLDEPMRPAYFEARFGPSRGGEETDAVLSTDEPFRLPLGDEELLLTGRIDRIDVGAVDGRPVFNVIDYKTAKGMTAAASDVASGVQLQLYLYALAAEWLLVRDRDAAPWRIGYWAVRDKGFLSPTENKKPLVASESVEGRLQRTEAWRALGEQVDERLREIVAGIRSGHFPPLYADEERAKKCEFKGVSRSLETRRTEKTAPALGLASRAGELTGGAS